MEINFIGANVRQGVSERTNKPYTVAEVLYATPDQSGEKRNEDNSVRWVYTAYGCKVRSIPIDPTAIHQFKACKPGSPVNLKLEPQPDNPSRNWVVGVA